MSPRERILRAAKLLFARQGFQHTSTIAITRAAQSSETQLVKNFGSKEGLLEAIFDEDAFLLWNKLHRRDTPDLSPVERLRLYIRAAVEHFENDLDAKVLLVTEHGRLRRKFGHDLVMSRGYVEACALVDQTLQEVCAVGQMRSDVQPRSLRACLLGTILQMWRDQLLRPESPNYSSEQIIATVDALLACFVPELPTV